MTAPSFRLGFIGAGKMAAAIIRGLVESGSYAPGEIIASRRDEAALAELRDAQSVTVTTDNAVVAAGAETILLAVKPAQVVPVLAELGELLAGKLVISLAAAARLASMEAASPARFVRALSNTPAAINKGATAYAPGARATAADVEFVEALFGAVGIIVPVEEAALDAVTGLSGSGPAFVYTVIEALTDAGVANGLPAHIAAVFAEETMLGAAELAIWSDRSPAELREQVITPGGTTAAGLAAFAEHGGREALIAAVTAATARAREIAAELT